jgi:O-antigen/teichoic acid export membrane protein
MKKTTHVVVQHLLWRGLYLLSVLFLNIWIARFFAAEKSGQIFYIVNNLAFLLLVVSLSLESGSTFYIASGKIDAAAMAGFCSVWAFVASLLATAGWATILYLMDSSLIKEAGFLSISFLFIIGVLLSTYFTALFYAEKEFGLPNKMLFVVNAFLIILLMAYKGQPLIRLYFVRIYFFTFFLQGLLLMILFFHKKFQTGSFRIPQRPMLKKIIRYSLAALLANCIYFLVNRIDYWFVQFYCSPAELGNYVQASKLAQMLFLIPGILGASLFPIFASSEKSENAEQVISVMRILLLINGVVCFIIICVGWYFIPVIFGPSFNHMYLLFVILVPGILCVTMNYPMAAWFSADNRVRINIRGSMLALTIICVGDVLLLPHYGIKVAAIMSSAGFLSYYCYTVSTYRKEFPHPWRAFLIIRRSDIMRIRQVIGNKIQDPGTENPIV